MTANRRTALAVMLGGFAFSVAANVLWTWPGGPVRVIGGLFASIALPAAVHLWPSVPAHNRTRRLLRLLAMGGIAVMAAWTTFVHAASLLVAHGEDPMLAACYPIMTELLVVMGVLAYRAPGVPASKSTSKSTSKPRPRKPAAPKAESEPAAPTLRAVTSTGDRAKELIAQGVARSTAYRRAAAGD